MIPELNPCPQNPRSHEAGQEMSSILTPLDLLSRRKARGGVEPLLLFTLQQNLQKEWTLLRLQNSDGFSVA